MKLLPALFACVAVTTVARAQNRLYVDDSAAPGGDGLDWTTAFDSIDDALAVASPGNRIWVAAGEYTPTVEVVPGDPRSASFALPPGVHLLGGFRGDEATIAERAGLYRETVLNGDIGVPGVPTDNVRNVLRLEGNGSRHTVDGFVVRGGYADGTGLARGGGAIAAQLGSKDIKRCLFIGNHGRIGGAILSQISIVRIDRCTFVANDADTRGGAVWASSSFSVSNSRFVENVAAQGGAVYANQGGVDPEDVPVTRFQNCLFHDNLANRGGAAFVGDPPGPVAAGKVVWSGCTFARNLAISNGAAIATSGAPSQSIVVDIQNSVVWGNLTRGDDQLSGDPAHYRFVRHSIVENGWPGAGNSTAIPIFADFGLRDLRLAAGSPGIDAGANDLVLRDTNDIDGDDDYAERMPIDFLGGARRLDDPAVPDTGTGGSPVVDMGAYER